MISPHRIRSIGGAGVQPGGRYVLYWMQRSQRVEWNHALEYAIAEADRRRLALYVCFCLPLLVVRAHPPEGLARLARAAALVVCDAVHAALQSSWRSDVGLSCPLIEVDCYLRRVRGWSMADLSTS